MNLGFKNIGFINSGFDTESQNPSFYISGSGGGGGGGLPSIKMDNTNIKLDNDIITLDRT